MYKSSDSVMMDNKYNNNNKNKKKKKKMIKNKIKNETAFLYYIAYNKDEKQTKEFLRYFTNPMQYILLRELVVNDLAENIPDYNTTKIKINLKKSMKYHIKCLACGELKKHNLHNIYPFIKILAKNVLQYNELPNN